LPASVNQIKKIKKTEPNTSPYGPDVEPSHAAAVLDPPPPDPYLDAPPPADPHLEAPSVEPVQPDLVETGRPCAGSACSPQIHRLRCRCDLQLCSSFRSAVGRGPTSGRFRSTAEVAGVTSIPIVIHAHRGGPSAARALRRARASAGCTTKEGGRRGAPQQVGPLRRRPAPHTSSPRAPPRGRGRPEWRGRRRPEWRGRGRWLVLGEGDRGHARGVAPLG
jgi:hypothetical protein